MSERIAAWLGLVAAVVLQGCTFVIPIGPSGPYEMPPKKSPASGVIFGSIESQGDMHLNLSRVLVLKKGHVYFGDIGEETVVLTNNYFITPNVAPGTYYISGFWAGSDYHSMENHPLEFTVQPGQLLRDPLIFPDRGINGFDHATD